MWVRVLAEDAVVPGRGHRAQVCAEIQGTAAWKDFSHLWTIDYAQWYRDLGSPEGAVNYAQAWSLAAYMMTSGVEGRKAFRKIFNLSRRVGADRKGARSKTHVHS